MKGTGRWNNRCMYILRCYNHLENRLIQWHNEVLSVGLGITTLDHSILIMYI